MGRPRKHEQPMVKLSLRLTPQHIEMIRFIGKGNASKGIRNLIYKSQGYEWTKWGCVVRSLEKQALCVIGYAVPKRIRISISIPKFMVEHFEYHMDFFQQKIRENKNRPINKFITMNRINTLSKIIMYSIEEYELDHHCCFDPDVELDELNFRREKIFLLGDADQCNWWGKETVDETF